MKQYDIFGDIVHQKLCKCGCGTMIPYYWTWAPGHHSRDPLTRDKSSEAAKKRYEENPMPKKTKEKLSQKTKEQFKDIILCKIHAKIMKKYYEENPISDITKEKHSEATKKRYEDPLEHEKSSEGHKKQYQNQRWNNQIDNFINGKPMIDWFAQPINNRSHVTSIYKCTQINERFENSDAHHISQSIVIFIPSELHKHIHHNIKTGQNMGEMNMLALQFINGCYDK